jgi:hypothetical protein
MITKYLQQDLSKYGSHRLWRVHAIGETPKAPPATPTRIFTSSLARLVARFLFMLEKISDVDM